MARRPEKSGPPPGLFDDPPQEVRKVPPRAGQKASDRAPEARRPAASGAEPDDPAAPYTVGQLTTVIKDRLSELGRIRVAGEITGFKRHTSGHIYFDLKDEGARISAVIWRSTVARGLSFEPGEGDQVLAVGRLDVYEPRGNYKLIVDRLEPMGVGALLAQLEKRKAELAARGWFERQRPLPRYPRRIGLVTSRDGAALKDVLRTRTLRWAGYPVRFCHAPMQGPGAAPAIAEAIARLDSSGVDVIVVCRGGGSLEDLWSFNELVVAEAIWHCSVPVISGVGHETDTTLADLVADRRAHTPTDAAQTVLPDLAELKGRFVRAGNYMLDGMERILARRKDRLGALTRRPALRDAKWILQARRDRLETAWMRLRPSMRTLLHGRSGRLATLQTRLERRSPRAALAEWQRRLGLVSARLLALPGRVLERAQHRLAQNARALEGVSPLAVLRRGYALTTRVGERTPLNDAAQLAVGDRVETRLAAGSFRSCVEATTGAEEAHE
ncbi:MAG: exodeoxyribonuclease VII large subunit [Planctomycetes bacterium]|jgi:exodeoxyribonuclease VII large subunit|nr:exodeoxyribonuclease VII large subunit [Planctomycetota bacterium]